MIVISCLVLPFEERFSGILCAHKSYLKPIGIIESVAQPMFERPAKILSFAKSPPLIGWNIEGCNNFMSAVMQHVLPGKSIVFIRFSNRYEVGKQAGIGVTE